MFQFQYLVKNSRAGWRDGSRKASVNVTKRPIIRRYNGGQYVYLRCVFNVHISYFGLLLVSYTCIFFSYLPKTNLFSYRFKGIIGCFTFYTYFNVGEMFDTETTNLMEEEGDLRGWVDFF